MEWIHWAGWPFLVASTVVVVLIVSLVYTILDRDRLAADLEDRTRKRDDALATQALIRQDRDTAIGERDAVKERARELAGQVDALEESLRAAREDVGREQGEVNALRRGHAELQRVAEHLRGRNVDLEGQAGVWRGRCEEVGRREQAALENYTGLKTSFEVRGRELADAVKERNELRANLAESERARGVLREAHTQAEARGAMLRRQLVALREAMAGQVQEIQAAVGGGGEAEAEDPPCVCGHARGKHAAAIRDAAGHGTPGQCCVAGCSCGRYESARHAEAEALAPAWALPAGGAAAWETALRAVEAAALGHGTVDFGGTFHPSDKVS